MSTQEFTAEQLQAQGYIKEQCRNCKKCGETGIVWIDPSRIKAIGPIGSIRHIIARDIVGVS